MSDARDISIHYEPREWQRKAGELMKRFNVLLVSRQSGKTVMSIANLVASAIADTRPNPRYAYMDPYLKQARRVAWMYLKDMTRDIPGVQQLEGERIIRFAHNGAEIELEGADTPDSLRGTYLDGVVIDEFEDMKPDVWEAVTLPKVLSRGGWVIIQGTLHGIGNLSQIYFKAMKDPSWYAGNFTAIDTGYPAPDELELAKKNMSARRFAQEYMNDLTAGSADALLSVIDCMNSQQRVVDYENYQFEPLIMGVDVSRGGDDLCAICFRKGPLCHNIEAFPWIGDVATADKIGQFAQKMHPDAIFVDCTGGYGAMAAAKLKQLGFKTQDVSFAQSPTDEQFVNKRVEMYWRGAQWIKNTGKLPIDNELIQELTIVKYDHDNAKQKVYIQSKDEIRKDLGRSPDKADAFMLTFAFNVYKPSAQEALLGRATNIQSSERYNPVLAAKKRAGLI